jgi:hypothetical protein
VRSSASHNPIDPTVSYGDDDDDNNNNYESNNNNKSMALVLERTIPIDRQRFVGEVSTKFAETGSVAWSARRNPTAVISVF